MATPMSFLPWTQLLLHIYGASPVHLVHQQHLLRAACRAPFLALICGNADSRIHHLLALRGKDTQTHSPQDIPLITQWRLPFQTIAA